VNLDKRRVFSPRISGSMTNDEERGVENVGSINSRLIDENMEEEPETRRQKIVKWIVRIILASILCACLGIIIWLFTKPQKMKKLILWLRDLGWRGNLICCAVFILTTLPFGTGYTEVAIACGFLYKLWLGVATTFVGVVIIGSPIAFFMCKFLFRNPVIKYINKKPKLKILLKAVQANGFTIIFMMRLTPVPMGIQNALFAISDISFWVFITATALGLLPEMFVWVFLGKSIQDVSEIVTNNRPMDTTHKVIIGVQITVTLLLLIGVFFLSRHVLKKAMNEQNSEEKESLLRPSDSMDSLATMGDENQDKHNSFAKKQ